MEDGWESHVSPLMMGVGMGDMQGLGELQAAGHGQDMASADLNMPPQHHDLHAELNPDMHQDIERDLGRHDMHHQDHNIGGHADYFSHQVRGRLNANEGVCYSLYMLSGQFFSEFYKYAAMLLCISVSLLIYLKLFNYLQHFNGCWCFN